MNFNDMKYAIYESYKNGEMSKDAATRLLESFESASIDSDLDIALEAADTAQSSFMESAMSYSNGYESQAVFEKKAESLSDKVKAAWEAFKKWIKQMIDKISSKISQIKAKITGKEDQNKKIKLPFDLSKVEKFLSDCIDHIKPPYDFQGWWDKFMNMPVLDLAKAAGIATGSIITISQRNKILDAIKDKLMKLSSKLTDLEAKNADTKGIHILRSIISMVNGLVIKAASSIHSSRDAEASSDLKDARARVNAAADKVNAAADAADTPQLVPIRQAIARSKDGIKKYADGVKRLTEYINDGKQKLAGMDPNEPGYDELLGRVNSYVEKRIQLGLTANMLRDSVKGLNKMLGTVDVDLLCAQKGFMAEWENYSSAVYTETLYAVRGAVADANLLAHTALKMRNKNNDKYTLASKEAYACIAEARGHISGIDGVIDDCIKTASAIKHSKAAIKKYNAMRDKIKSFESQINSVENFLKSYKL